MKTHLAVMVARSVRFWIF